MNARAGLLAVVALALTGCTGSLLESSAEAPATYRLEGEALADRGARLPLALGVARPRAAQALGLLLGACLHAVGPDVDSEAPSKTRKDRRKRARVHAQQQRFRR